MPKEFTPQERATIYYYEQTAPQWSATHSDVNFWTEELAIFQQYLPRGLILEIGSGGGRDAQALNRAGYCYIGVDVSTQLLQQARLQNSSLMFLRRSFYRLSFEPNYFDGFWCSATLLHLPKANTPLALNNIHEVIRPGGIGFITVKEGSGDMVHEEETVNGMRLERYFTYYQKDEFGSLLKQTGYKILQQQTRVDSPRSTWLIYFLEVRK